METTEKLRQIEITEKKTSVIEVEPPNVYQSKHTSCLLPWYSLRDPVDNPFATTVNHSVGHLTSIL
jgi:hypothetical protein